MRRDLVIFGITAYAKQMHHYFSTSPDHRVVAFTADAQYITEPSFCGLPVLPFETLTNAAPPDQFDLYIAVGYNGVNEGRRSKYVEAKAKGYTLASYVHASAVVASGVSVGDNTFIGELTVIKPFATLGCDLQMGAHVHVGHNAVIRDHAFVAAGSKLLGAVDIGECCFIGGNATVRDHVTVGARCVVGAGAVILSDCEPEGVYRAAGTPRREGDVHTLRRI